MYVGSSQRLSLQYNCSALHILQILFTLLYNWHIETCHFLKKNKGTPCVTLLAGVVTVVNSLFVSSTSFYSLPFCS